MEIDVTIKKNFQRGMLVDIVAEADKEQGTLTRGYIQSILSKANQKQGIKVELTTGIKGRVSYVPTKDDIRLENFKFYNKFFFLNKVYSIWHKTERRYVVLDYENRMGKIEKTVMLFENKQDGVDFMKEANLSETDYMVKEINRKKTINENFMTLSIDFYRINRERKLSFERMNEWEHYFKNMR